MLDILHVQKKVEIGAIDKVYISITFSWLHRKCQLTDPYPNLYVLHYIYN